MIEQKRVYVFSGLGADERIFKHIEFYPFEPIFVKWIPPFKNEDLKSYAGRILVQIPEVKPFLIGVSFGGIMAIEVAKLISTEKIVLISSAKTRKEIPFYFRIAGFLNIHKLIPTRALKKGENLNNWLFGANNKEDRQLLKEILADTDSRFFEWAIDRIAHWQNRIIPSNLRHIHGIKDKIFPIKYIHCDFRVLDGGHLMTLNKGSEISNLIWKCIYD
jgi:pimeloyl-ACP methyl ester carboxylesterase